MYFQFVLKHEKFKSLCEITGYPSALCPSNPGKLETIVLELYGQVDSVTSVLGHVKGCYGEFALIVSTEGGPMVRKCCRHSF